MGTITLVRVDERLAHGVVTSTWIPFSGATQVLCIDDIAAKDPFLVKIHENSVKPGILMETITVAQALERNANGSLLKRDKAFLLFRNIQTAFKCKDGGIDFDSLQVGNTYMGPGKVQLAPTLFFSQQEVDLMRKYASAGMEIYYRGTANQGKVPLEDLVKKCRKLK